MIQVHENHRDRMRKRFLRDGLDHFEKHEIIEMLLFGLIPRRNTNDIAHRLIDRFGSISGIIDAPYSEIMKVKGIGENGAISLKFFSEFIRMYLLDQADPGNKILTREDIGKIFINKFFNMTDECLAVMLLDKYQKMKSCDIIRKGNFNSIDINAKEIFNYATKYNSNSVIIAHNYPGGLALPSANDIKSTFKLKQVLRAMSIDLVDHYVISSDDWVSFVDAHIDQSL